MTIDHRDHRPEHEDRPRDRNNQGPSSPAHRGDRPAGRDDGHTQPVPGADGRPPGVGVADAAPVAGTTGPGPRQEYAVHAVRRHGKTAYVVATRSVVFAPGERAGEWVPNEEWSFDSEAEARASIVAHTLPPAALAGPTPHVADNANIGVDTGGATDPHGYARETGQADARHRHGGGAPAASALRAGAVFLLDSHDGDAGGARAVLDAERFPGRLQTLAANDRGQFVLHVLGEDGRATRYALRALTVRATVGEALPPE